MKSGCDEGVRAMLMLGFSVGPMRFAVDAARVVRVVPRVALRPLPVQSVDLAGLLDVGTHVVPVIDLCTRLTGSPCRDALGTRIVLVRLRHDDREVELGVIAECVTEINSVDAGVVREGAPHAGGLGPVFRAGDGLSQWLDVDGLLTPEQCRGLYDGVLGRTL